VWQQIDYLRFIRDFGPRIMHVHAKDLTVDKEMLYQDGILGSGFRSEIPKLPGMGDVNWRMLIGELYSAGYDYVISIEHEDANWEGTEDLVKRGFLLAKQALEPWVV
jgi:sugar phosphate isomerase/epimerase